ncbi:hypothetical protein DL96DRAFT_234995 [Flagelloscypha sp. PMI_526]|nr:hypothetical protein DL96DRAFT_234995 [Flagelloscypha sp. PMI_526]
MSANFHHFLLLLPSKKKAMDVSNLRQVPDLWYPDGGIVLQAGNCLFRVYQGILSAQSSVFADMFNLAQSGDELVDQYDGQPLVVLH